ncbi:MAG TPA: glycosyltransferase family 39 protein [Thermoplasmata archaeon]|nr:glycosyltransferase family 39 protein [Thermoplasmata archaeon]
MAHLPGAENGPANAPGTTSSGTSSTDEAPATTAPRSTLHLGWFATPSGLTLLVILGFMVVGGYWRLEALGSVSLWNDEAQSTIYSLSILQHGYPIIVSQHLINNWEPLYPYVEAVSIGALGQSNFADRFPSALLGIALIPIAYAVGVRLRDRYVGITLAAMVAFSTEYIAWSRQARWYMLFIVLMAIALLVLLVWSTAQTRRARRGCAVGVTGVSVALALTSPGLFLMYVPGILCGLLGFLLASRWDRLREFFRGPVVHGEPSGPTGEPLIPHRLRLPLLGAGVLALVVGVLLEWSTLAQAGHATLSRLVGFSTYPLVWSTAYAVYLAEYYPAIVALSVASIFFIARRRNPLEIGLLAFAGGAFASVSVASSVTNDIAGGVPVVLHHITPLLFTLFLLSAITIVETVRWAVTSLARRWPKPRHWARAAPALYGGAIVVMLVVPSVAIPSGLTLNNYQWETPVDSWLPWVPFSIAPSYPWALYQVQQANYQLASNYVLQHRVPGEVVGATTTGPPAIYLGKVDYWIRGNPIPSTIYYVDGQPTFYQTGARLVSNTSQLESLLYNDSGWFISDMQIVNGPQFPGDMNLVVKYFMTYITWASDSSIHLYHWNQSTPVELLQELIQGFQPLSNYTRNFTLQQDLAWAVTNGVTSFYYKPLLIPMAPWLIPSVQNVRARALGILFNQWNSRASLQLEFPGVGSPPYNSTHFVRWACEVASGTVSDPAYPLLTPYKSVYCG